MLAQLGFFFTLKLLERCQLLGGALKSISIEIVAFIYLDSERGFKFLSLLT